MCYNSFRHNPLARVPLITLYAWVYTAEGLHKGMSRLRSEEHTSELQSHSDLVCRLLLEKKKKKREIRIPQSLQAQGDIPEPRIVPSRPGYRERNVRRALSERRCREGLPDH